MVEKQLNAIVVQLAAVANVPAARLGPIATSAATNARWSPSKPARAAAVARQSTDALVAVDVANATASSDGTSAATAGPYAADVVVTCAVNAATAQHALADAGVVTVAKQQNELAVSTMVCSEYRIILFFPSNPFYR